jgi:hypothetical protein
MFQETARPINYYNFNKQEIDLSVWMNQATASGLAIKNNGVEQMACHDGWSQPPTHPELALPLLQSENLLQAFVATRRTSRHSLIACKPAAGLA